VKSLFWLLRREFWEHRAILIAPLITAAVILIGTVTKSLIQPAQDPSVPLAKLQYIATIMSVGFALPFFIVSGFVALFYLMDSLYGERKDRSVLFWRSLPVSDTAAVSAKLITALVVAPCLAALTAAATMPLITLIFKASFANEHYSAIPLMWSAMPFGSAVVLWFYATAVFVLWFLPVCAWFLAVSAWAPKNPFLWGLVPPAALWALERLSRGTSWLGDQITSRIDGWFPLAFNTHVAGGSASGISIDGKHAAIPANLLEWIDPWPLLASPQLWIGIVLGIAFVFLAVQGRRYRTEA
jgi:ABC-2 type transport system permease protein